MDSASQNEALRIHREYRERLRGIVSELGLPHRLPEPSEALHLPQEPLGQVRKVIAKAFAPDGWQIVSDQPSGSHRFWKASPMGRLMLLEFDTGSWLRAVVGFLKLVPETSPDAPPSPFLRLPKAFSAPLMAEDSLRHQYPAPNREVFRHILENMAIVARQLERSWTRDIESALGSLPTGYQRPHP